MSVAQATFTTTEERLRALHSALAGVPAGSPAAVAYQAAIKRILTENGGSASC